ncbi:MAG: amidohydrolase [Micrococcaceae bacterium]
MSQKTLYYNAVIHSPTAPDASAMLVDGEDIAWLGSDESAKNFIDASVEKINCQGSFIAPGFVDAHVHVIGTGAALNSLNLASCQHSKDLLKAVESCKEQKILGHSWDETTWHDTTLPTLEEVDTITTNQLLYLARIDIHSGIINSATAEKSGLKAQGLWDGTSLVEGKAHEIVSDFMRKFTPAERQRFHKAALQKAASQGIVAVTEMNGPLFGGVEDLEILLQHENVPEILLYWGQQLHDTKQAQELLHSFKKFNVLGFAGDLNIDGSIGSRTAFMHEEYTDMPGVKGNSYLDAQEIKQHLILATQLGVQGGFHVIGDAAMSEAVAGAQQAAEVVGLQAFRAANHRFEHAECATTDQLQRIADLNISLSVQPAFDAFWGGKGGMYEQRVGQRAHTMNPFRTMMQHGISLSFGSDTPVTPFDPWGTVKAALFHHAEEERITARAAFNAHTRYGWRAAKFLDRGTLDVGAKADFALWDVQEFGVQTPAKAQNWSTDTRSRTPLLPLLSPDTSNPECLLTSRQGTTIYSQLP